MKKGKIYLLPTTIGDTPVWDVIPEYNRGVMAQLSYFIVEDVRSARRFISSAKLGLTIDQLTFETLNEHSTAEQIEELIKPVLEGLDAGVMSEAGVPGVADPGAQVVALAHRYGVEVVPLVGPSSILLAMMASGLNGQSFAFNGYLPIKPAERVKAIRHFEKRALAENQSQVFIEAPYRNGKLVDDILASCLPDTMVTIACDILQPDQFIRTLPVSDWKDWKRNPRPELHKRPAIFIIGGRL